jgi:hypothetical protein
MNQLAINENSAKNEFNKAVSKEPKSYSRLPFEVSRKWVNNVIPLHSLLNCIGRHNGIHRAQSTKAMSELLHQHGKQAKKYNIQCK